MLLMIEMLLMFGIIDIFVVADILIIKTMRQYFLSKWIYCKQSSWAYYSI